MSGSRHSPQDSFVFKLSSLSEGTVFVLGIFPPQDSLFEFFFIRNGAPAAHDALCEEGLVKGTFTSQSERRRYSFKSEQGGSLCPRDAQRG